MSKKTYRPVGRPVIVEATMTLAVGICPELKGRVQDEARTLGCSASELTRRLLWKFFEDKDNQ